MTASRVVFAGTPEFARVSLAAMVDAGIHPVAVYTQPDRPQGRGRKLGVCPVKAYAEQQGLTVLQPQSLKHAATQKELAALRPDLVVVAAYGLIFPQAVLDIPVRACINVHASLLPRWRGAAPIQAAILAGDEQSGISLMQMEAGLDSGPVYATIEVPIGAETTAGDLHDALAAAGGQLLADCLPDIASGRLLPEPQCDDDVSYAGKISSADSNLDWGKTAQQLERQVRAYNPVPGARFYLRDELIKCWRSAVVANVDGGAPGTVVAAGKSGVDVACGSGVLRLQEVQRAGRRRISGAELAAQESLVGRLLTADPS
ncbi:MAG: methionyl-tRNA formyltransferase [Woeseia sp.]|nr:methionyl-tRNA formyltransferase [Woeseia sp.]